MNHPNYSHPELVTLCRFLRSQTNLVPEDVRREVGTLINVRSFTCAQKKYVADHAHRFSQRSGVTVRSILVASTAQFQSSPHQYATR